MSFMKNSNCLLQKSKWLPEISEKICFHSKQIHRNTSPLLDKDAEKKCLQILKSEAERNNENLSAKADRLPRSIFGATILPQNLSFENSKKLTENKVRLEDIPLVDEHEAAETLLQQKLKGQILKLNKEQSDESKQEDDFGVTVIETNLLKHLKESRKPAEEPLLIANSYDDIPGPRFLWSLINALKASAHQLTIVSLFQLIKSHALTAYRTYGPVIRLPEFLGGKIVLISRPEHMFAVFEQDQRYPIDSTLDSIQRSRLYRHERNMEGTKYHLDEEEWNRLRKSVKTPLMKGYEKYFDAIDEASNKFLRRIKYIRNRQDEVPDDFLYEINKWSLECLCFVLFDKSYGFLDNESNSWPSKTSCLLYSLTVATKDLCRLETGFQLWRFMNTSFLTSLASALGILEGSISEYVAQVQLELIKKKESSDLNSFRNLSLVEGLLLQTDLPPDDIVGNILDTLLIGINTMSVALGFLLYHLSQNPRAQSELWKEIKEILPEKYSRLEYEQVNELRYLQACLKESLRLKMPIPVLNRVLSRNIILSNYQIPKGTFVLMTPQVEGMKEENFSDPNEFLPERWLEQEYSHPYTELPTRNYFLDTFERRMAEIAVWVCASQILRHFWVEYSYGGIEATNTVISFPNKPLRFAFVEREN